VHRARERSGETSNRRCMDGVGDGGGGLRFIVRQVVVAEKSQKIGRPA